MSGVKGFIFSGWSGILLRPLSTVRELGLPGCSGVALATSIEYNEWTWFAWLKRSPASYTDCREGKWFVWLKWIFTSSLECSEGHGP